MLKLFLWLRYLRKKKIVFLSIAAVALSVALLIVIANLFSGFIGAVEETGREIFGDIHFVPEDGIPNYQQLLGCFEALEEVEAAAAYLDTHGLLYLGKGNVKGVHVLGIEPARHAKVVGLKEKLIEHKYKKGEVTFGPKLNEIKGFVGIGIFTKPDTETDEYDLGEARKWIGRKVVLTTGTVLEREGDGSEDKKQRSVKQRTLKFEIADVVFSGIYFRDSSDIFLPIETVRGLISSKGSPAGIGRERIRIKLTEGVKPELMLSKIRGVWAEFAREQGLGERSVTNVWLKTSEDMQRWFLAELRKQMGVLMMIFGIVCSAVVLLVFCIFYMIVMTRRKDVAIIKSCGTSGGSVALIFIGFGVCVGMAGSAFGVILGWLVTRNINIIEYWIRVIFGLKLWKSSVYVFEKIPAQMDLIAALWIVLFAIVAVVVGVLVSAVVAARTKPVDILRYE